MESTIELVVDLIIKYPATNMQNVIQTLFFQFKLRKDTETTKTLTNI